MKNRKIKSVPMLFILTLVMLIGLTNCANEKTFYNVTVEVTSENESKIETQTITVKPYGIFNSNKKIEGIEYDVVIGNIIWSAILVETIVIPIYLVGWRIMEPGGLETDKIKVIK